MKLLRLVVAAVLVSSIVVAPAIAREKGGMMEHGVISGEMMDHHGIMKQMDEMIKKHDEMMKKEGMKGM